MIEPARQDKNESITAGRSVARLAAVQALYQMDLAATDSADVIAEFSAHRFGQEVDGAQYDAADAVFFSGLVKGVVRDQRTIDPMINTQLAEGWRLSRIDSILRAILRAGTVARRRAQHQHRTHDQRRDPCPRSGSISHRPLPDTPNPHARLRNRSNI